MRKYAKILPKTLISHDYSTKQIHQTTHREQTQRTCKSHHWYQALWQIIPSFQPVDVGVVVFNGKDENGVSFRKQLEVDFVCNKGSRRYYIQSALSLPTPEKMDQETNSLRRIDDGFEKIVIVGEHLVSNHDNNGILFMSIYEFMSKELS